MTYSVINNLLLASISIAGFSQVGKIGAFFCQRVLKIKWPIHFLGQDLLLGYALSTSLISWLSLCVSLRWIYQASEVLILMLGVLLIGHWILSNLSKKKVFNFFRVWTSSLDFPNMLFGVIVLLYLFANYGPVTNGDSLDYHLGYAYNFLREPFEPHPDWYSARMSQSGEKLIAIGLSLDIESLANLIQFTSLLGICSLIRYAFEHNGFIDRSQKNYLLLAFISSPILLFLAISAKPQLMPVALTTLAFALLINLVKVDNLNSSHQCIGVLGIILFLASIAMSQKFSFYISGLIIFLFSALVAYKKKIFIQFFCVAVLIFLFALAPVFIDKFQRYHGAIIDLILNPVAGSTDSLRLFIQWLKAYRENILPFPLYLIIPSKLGNFSTVLGVGVFIIFACFYIFRQIPKYVALLYLLFIILIVFIGQPSSRFYLEAYIWALLIFAYFGRSIKNTLVLIFAACCIAFQSALVIASLGVYDFNLAKAYLNHNVVNFQDKYAYGADLARWLDAEFPDKGPVLYDHRSHAFTSRVLISTYPIEFFGEDGIDIEILRKNLIRLNVDKLLTYSSSPNFDLLQACSAEKLAGPKKLIISTRNPFNSGLTYNAFVYKINPNQLIECVIQKSKK